MNDIQKITDFVEHVFDRYQASKYDFFFTYEGRASEQVRQPLFPTGELDDDTLRRISNHIGLTKNEIITMDMKAAMKYWNKYPFFRLYRKYMDAWSWHQNFIGEMPTVEELFLKAIFSDKDDIRGEHRYDMNDLRARLVSTLKEIDQAIPGTYHEGAEITELRVSTQIFFSFPQCSEMIRSFIDMVKRTEELFFLSLHNELSEEDANELNFLASWLNAVDVVMPSKVMNYENVRTYRAAYLEENHQDFFSYVKIKSFIGTEPWRCQEFFDDMDLVSEFFYIFPHAKAGMRQFAHDVARFSCTFIWSDADYVRFSEEDEQMMDEFDAILGYEPISESERAKEVTHIYVDKKPEEMLGWDKFAKQLKIAAGPTSKGGIAVPNRQSFSDNPAEAIERMKRRVAVQHGGALNG